MRSGRERQGEPMQQAVDELYRRQPEAFTREPVAPPATEDDAAIDHAIGLHHLLAYEQLAGERDLARLRDDAARNGGAIDAPLTEAMATRRAEILAMAPEALRDAAGRRFDASAERLGPKAAAVDRLLADQRRAVALEQSIALGEALLREDPDRYEELLAEAEPLAAALAPDPVLRDSLSAVLRRRYATAALEGDLGPAGDPARAEADLARGRFRDAFDADEHAAWKEFAAFGRQRRAAEAVKLARDGEVAAEAGMLGQLAAAARGEAPLPPVAAIEAAFPGEGEARQAAAKRDLKRQLYETQIALQPLDADEDWILAGEEGEDALLRVRIVFNKRQAVERGDWEYLRRQVPTLAAAIEEAVEDPSKLGAAIALYQRHLAKLGVPPEKRWLLPDEALRRIAGAYDQLRPPADRLEWLERLAGKLGGQEALTLVDALAERTIDFDPNARPTLEALLDPERRDTAIDILRSSERDADYREGYYTESRINPNTGKLEQWEVSDKGHERRLSRPYAGGFAKLETRVDLQTGASYEVEVFSDGSERPQIPADADYPALWGLALEAWQAAAYEQVVNPDTWRLAAPASEEFQELYRRFGRFVPDFQFVGANGIVYERSDITEEPTATRAARERETALALEEQEAALREAIETGDFRDILGPGLNPGLLIGFGALGLRRSGRRKNSLFRVRRYTGPLSEFDGADIRNLPSFRDYLANDADWARFKASFTDKRNADYLRQNAVYFPAAGSLFEKAVIQLFREKGYDIMPARRIPVAGSFARPDGSIGFGKHGLILEFKATSMPDEGTGQLRIPRLSRNQTAGYGSEVSKGTTVVLVFRQGFKLAMVQLEAVE